ncbi:hypothetical protein EUGRSUZ_D01875 [Eucalyptus grandis]|uniref:Uncharacterized protein n=2 Tax=Eucalyptus grandis TaxID=71139 RepID=A0ACC3L6K9_EUCGR|nr:hypothetical protein EUGRSUZ_D01875 [Eucalyptus grandis]
MDAPNVYARRNIFMSEKNWLASKLTFLSLHVSEFRSKARLLSNGGQMCIEASNQESEKSWREIHINVVYVLYITSQK